MKKKPRDRHLDIPAEANRDKHINYTALEDRDTDPADDKTRGKLNEFAAKDKSQGKRDRGKETIF